MVMSEIKENIMNKPILALLTLFVANIVSGAPVPPTQLTATLGEDGRVLLAWRNNYTPPKKKGAGNLTVMRGVSFSLAGDPFWGPGGYSYVSWTPIARLSLSMTAYVDVPPAGVDLSALRYRVLVSAGGVTVSSGIVAISP